MDQESQEPTEKQAGNFQRLLEAGQDISGNLIGVALGFAVAGPHGALTGAVATPVVKHLFGLATDVMQRSISQQETKRIGATLAFAAAKIREKLNNGQQLRDDGFFTDTPGDRAPAAEIAEGVVMAAQREHQQKKLKCYGTLLANLAFNPGIDRAYANFLLRTVEALTYRQICLLMLFGSKNSNTDLGLRQSDYRLEAATIPAATIPVLYEAFDLYSRGLISGGSSVLLGLTDIKPGQMMVQGAGWLLLNLMELPSLDVIDLNELIPLLRN